MNKGKNVSRRSFLAGGAMLGTGAIVPAALAAAGDANTAKSSIMKNKRPDAAYGLDSPENTLYSSCLQCNTGCGIKVKLQDGVISKIDGNAYNPWTLVPHLPYATHITDAQAVDGAICPKGHAGIQIAYDPYRLRKVLKRAGKRGENKWTTISFENAIKEICDGGKLFAGVAGEEGREVEGLKKNLALMDAGVTKAMEADIKKMWDEKDKDKKKAMIAAFKATYAAHLDKLIDPEHPDFGIKNNQVVVSWGRLKDGRGDIYKRFAAAMGTTNAHGHTTVCQGSLYFTCKAISDQYIGGKFTDGQKFYWQADTENSKFILFVGANLLDANYGPPNRTARLTGNLVTGKTKIAVVDPRYSKIASKAWKWVPIKPGADAAMAMGIMRWMFEQNKIDAKFLACANKAAAIAAGEDSWTNATYLVALKDGKPGKLVRAADVMIGDKPLKAAEIRKTKEGKEFEEKFLTAMSNGQPVAVDPDDEKQAVTADLFVDTKLPNGTVVKSGLQILRESVNEHTIAEWAEIAGITEADIIDVARELTSYGKKAAVDIHRGPAQHTNGFYNVLSWMSINMLLGNFDAKGGMLASKTYDVKGKDKGELFDLTKHPKKPTAFGITSIRHGLDYEKTSLFLGNATPYPAKRNWYPLSSDIYEEIVPSIGDAYPYQVKTLFMYMGAPTYALPAGHTNIDILCDTAKLPLFVCSDILIGSTSMYADYIFPDISFLERWEFQGSHPNMANKVQPVRQPVIAPIPEECTVYGQKMPISLESMVLGIAEYLNLPGFGAEGLGPNLALQHPDDFFLRAVANLAYGEKPDGSSAVPDADAREIEIFLKARKHLPVSVFDAERWKKIVGEKMWPKVVYVLNRGGRFQDYEKGYKGERAANAYGKLLNIYQEKTASTTHSGTGKHNKGYACYLPIMDSVGKEPTDMCKGYPLTLITHRVVTQTKSRTIVSPWLSAIMPENGIIINKTDADKLGFSDGQEVKVVSATNPNGTFQITPGQSKTMIGKLVVSQGIRPGVVSFALGFGHWATGAGDVTIDGHVIKGEVRRAKGIHANAAMWIDPALKNTCMFDPVGGSVSFYDTQVNLVKV